MLHGIWHGIDLLDQVYRVALEQDGHSSQQPFPHINIDRFVDGLEGLLGVGGNTTAPAPTGTQATTSAQQPKHSVPIPTTGSVTTPTQAKPSTTVAHGMIEHEILTLYTYPNT